MYGPARTSLYTRLRIAGERQDHSIALAFKSVRLALHYRTLFLLGLGLLACQLGVGSGASNLLRC